MLCFWYFFYAVLKLLNKLDKLCVCKLSHRIVANVNTGQGASQLHLMNQNVRTTDAVVFATVNTGQGANELYDMNQNVTSTSAVTGDRNIV